MNEQRPSKKLSSGPWKVAIGSEQAMENWLVARTGHSIEHNDEVIYITTDHVHASMAVSYPFEDAEFIVRCRNYAMQYGDPVDEMEAVRKALREAGYVGDDPVAGIRGLRLLFDAERAENEPPAEREQFNPPWRAEGLAIYDRSDNLVVHVGITGNRSFSGEKLERMAQMIADVVNRAAQPPDSAPIAPIAKLIVSEDDVVRAVMYAPGLPPGEHDLYPEGWLPDDHRDQTITSLCDRIERIFCIAIDQKLTHVERIKQIQEWSAGFMQPPCSTSTKGAG